MLPTSIWKYAFSQRREQIVGERRQLSRDIDYYNKTRKPETLYQKMFDFGDDIEEGEFPSTMS